MTTRSMPGASLTVLVTLVAALPAVAAVAPERDETLSTVIAQALARRPELAQAEAEVRASTERVPQAKAWADPMVQVSVQNDGFTSWQVGKGETSWVQVMGTQTIPFPGKTELRGDVVRAEVKQQQALVERARLATIAEVRRAYVSLQLARDRQALLEKLAGVWERSAAVTQARYETGAGAQSDVLRARLEQVRLQQRRRLLDSEARVQLAALNRLRGLPLDTSLAVKPLRDGGFPAPPEAAAALEQARARSPELAAARAGVERLGRAVALSETAALPDLTFGAGVMVRGLMEPMWSLSVGIPLPVAQADRQARGVAEAKARADGATRGVEAVEQLLALRVSQRLDAWRVQQEIWKAYEQGLLGQAEAAADSALTQYQVGKVTFASVLEANIASLSEADASLQVLADGWRLAISDDEVSLAEAGSAAAPMGAASVPGAGAVSGGSRMSSSSSAAPEASGGGGSSGM